MSGKKKAALPRKFVVLVGGSSGYVDQVEKFLAANDLAETTVGYYDPVTIEGAAALRVPPSALANGQAFETPIEVGEHEIRVFFSRIGRGVHAVQHYVGHKLATGAEALDFFAKKVGEKVYGKGWLAAVLDDATDEKTGTVLVHGARETDVAEIRAKLGEKNVALVWILPGYDASAPAEADFYCRETSRSGEPQQPPKRLVSDVRKKLRGETEHV